MPNVGDMFDSIEAKDTGSNEGGKEERKRREMDRVKDGTYVATVDDFSVFSTEGGDFYVSWWFVVSEGLANGAELQSFSSVNPGSVKFIKRTVQRITGRFPEWSDLFNTETGRTGSLRDDVLGKSVQITQKTKNKNGKNYVNVYVDKLLKPESATPPAALPSEPSPGSGTESPDDPVDMDDLF